VARAPRLTAALRAQFARCLGAFREAVGRRRRRDAERLRRYFDDLERDLRRRQRRRGGEALGEKIAALPAEHARRLAQLEADAVVRVRLDLVAAVALRAPGLTAEVEVHRRKRRRTLAVRYDAIARRWTGLGCDGCGAATLAFALCDEAAHVLCPACWAACGDGGHRPCFRCGGQPERLPGDAPRGARRGPAAPLL
jgi:hypothetical protein